MKQRILITGGTGTLGREIVQQLLEAEREVSVLTSKANPNLPLQAKIYQGDLTDQSTLHHAVSDAEVIIHCASNSLDPQNVDIKGTKNLLSAIPKDKLKHFIYISIVGVDKSEFPYYKAKYEVEKMVEDSGLPYTILRATQFHDFILHRLIHTFDKGPCKIMQLPQNMKLQPIDITEVAEVVIKLTDQSPGNRILSIGGPEILPLENMVQVYLEQVGRNEKIELVPMDIFKPFQTGINLCPGDSYGKITWKEYLSFNLKG